MVGNQDGWRMAPQVARRAKNHSCKGAKGKERLWGKRKVKGRVGGSAWKTWDKGGGEEWTRGCHTGVTKERSRRAGKGMERRTHYPWYTEKEPLLRVTVEGEVG